MSIGQFDQLKPHLLKLFVSKIIVHADGDLVKQARITYGKTARFSNFIKQFTAHNGKMGLNFIANKSKPTYEETGKGSVRMFPTSYSKYRTKEDEKKLAYEIIPLQAPLQDDLLHMQPVGYSVKGQEEIEKIVQQRVAELKRDREKLQEQIDEMEEQLMD